jgi:hypothetical protein
MMILFMLGFLVVTCQSKSQGPYGGHILNIALNSVLGEQGSSHSHNDQSSNIPVSTFRRRCFNRLAWFQP